MSAGYCLQGICHRYGERAVLRVPELEIASGSSLAIIGPSGAGKSTLLRLLALLEAPSEGEIKLDGEPVGPASPLSLRRQLTMMFQRPLLLRGSVWRNVGYGLDVRGRRDDQQIRRAIEAVGLSQLTNASVQTLSGGEQQRVALARALIIEPRVLLLDEPTAHLDPGTVAIIEETLSQLHQKRGTTVIFATHNLHQVLRLADRVLVLLDGELIEAGEVEQIMHAPCDPRTQAFIEGGIVY